MAISSAFERTLIYRIESFAGAVLGIFIWVGHAVKGPSKFWVGQREWCTLGRISFG